MEFINKCNAIFDEADLEEAIKQKCKEINKKLNDKYTINCRGGYPSLCIAHEHFRIHRLLGEYYFGYSEIVHHKDKNKQNASKSNLIPMTNKEHTKEHYLIQYVSDEHKKGFGKRVSNIIRRNDITKEKIMIFIEQGLSCEETAKTLNCGANTIRRRLGMKA